MKSNLTGGNQIVVGTLLEDGHPLAAGVGIVDSSGRGMFQVAELGLQAKSQSRHEIADLYGNRWPVENVSADCTVAMNLHYDFTHRIRLPELAW